MWKNGELQKLIETTTAADGSPTVRVTGNNGTPHTSAATTAATSGADVVLVATGLDGAGDEVGSAAGCGRKRKAEEDDQY